MSAAPGRSSREDDEQRHERREIRELTADECPDIQQREACRSLGVDLFVSVDTSEHHVLAGDVLLLCSDGLHGAVSGAEIARTVTAGGPAGNLTEAARTLIALANEHDGSDNVSVLLIRIKNVERVGMYRGRPYKLR